jgi:hypothetical protein
MVRVWEVGRWVGLDLTLSSPKERGKGATYGSGKGEV